MTIIDRCLIALIIDQPPSRWNFKFFSTSSNFIQSFKESVLSHPIVSALTPHSFRSSYWKQFSVPFLRDLFLNLYIYLGSPSNSFAHESSHSTISIVSIRLDVFLLAIIATRAIAGSASSLDSNGDCDDGFVICAPPDATSNTTPHIGDAAFANLFTYIVQSSLPPSKRSLSGRATASLCCNALLSCLTITALGLPMCYDKLTTNYFLPDGS